MKSHPKEMVSDYSIRQLEDALKGKRSWNEWRDEIKRRYNNPTKTYLDDLFKAYE